MLKKLKKQVFTTQEAREAGVSPRMLHHLKAEGHLERLAHGVYTFSDAPPIAFQEIVAEKVTAIPNSVVGLFSALQFLNLTDNPPGEIHLIVPHSNQPKKQVDDVVFHYSRSPLKQLDTYKVDGIKVTTLEQTLVDLLKKGEPVGSVRKTLEDAKRKGLKFSFSKLISLGEKFRAKEKVKQLMEALDED